jgi:hypothetical protein
MFFKKEAESSSCCVALIVCWPGQPAGPFLCCGQPVFVVGTYPKKEISGPD